MTIGEVLPFDFQSSLAEFSVQAANLMKMLPFVSFVARSVRGNSNRSYSLIEEVQRKLNDKQPFVCLNVAFVTLINRSKDLI